MANVPFSTISGGFPPDVRMQIERASELVRKDFGRLVEKFGITADWQSAGPEVELRLTADKHDSHRITLGMIPISNIRDEESARAALTPMILKHTRALNDLVGVGLARIRDRIREDREAFAEAVEA